MLPKLDLRLLYGYRVGGPHQDQVELLDAKGHRHNPVCGIAGPMFFSASASVLDLDVGGALGGQSVSVFASDSALAQAQAPDHHAPN